MPMRPPFLLVAALLLNTSAAAESIRLNLAKAADRLEDALARDDRGGRGECRHRIERELGRIIDAIDDLRPADDPARFDQVATRLSEVQTQARRAQCGDEMLREVARALAELTDATSDARRRRSGDRRDDGPPVPVQQGVTFQGAQITESGGQGAVVSIPTATIVGHQGSQVYFAWHWRPENGGWSPWESLPAIAVDSQSFVWHNPYRQLLDYGLLRATDKGTGRFIVHGGIFDLQGRELGGVDLTVQVHYPRKVVQPPKVPVLTMNVVPPPPPPQAGALPPPPPGQGSAGNALPPPPPLNAPARDCGLGSDDPGCGLSRGGGQPMDRPTWEGFWAALKGNVSEPGRLGMVRDTCRSKFITARQLGALMEAFVGENNKLEMVTACAPHVVDPNNALGLATRFISTSRQREYNEIMTRQR